MGRYFERLIQRSRWYDPLPPGGSVSALEEARQAVAAPPAVAPDSPSAPTPDRAGTQPALPETQARAPTSPDATRKRARRADSPEPPSPPPALNREPTAAGRPSDNAPTPRAGAEQARPMPPANTDITAKAPPLNIGDAAAPPRRPSPRLDDDQPGRAPEREDQQAPDTASKPNPRPLPSAGAAPAGPATLPETSVDEQRRPPARRAGAVIADPPAQLPADPARRDSRRGANQPPAGDPEPPTGNHLEVHIGRVELKVHQPATPAPQRRPAKPAPAAKRSGLHRHYLKGW